MEKIKFVSVVKLIDIMWIYKIILYDKQLIKHLHER